MNFRIRIADVAANKETDVGGRQIALNAGILVIAELMLGACERSVRRPALTNQRRHQMSWKPEQKRSFSYWLLQGTGWLFLAYLTYAQLIPVFDYELGVRMGTQEPASKVIEVGVAYWKGFAFGDLVTYAPILLAGLIGHLYRHFIGHILLAAALGITVYWPIVSLAAVVAAKKANGWTLTDTTAYWIFLPVIVAWGLWGLWVLVKDGLRSA